MENPEAAAQNLASSDAGGCRQSSGASNTPSWNRNTNRSRSDTSSSCSSSVSITTGSIFSIRNGANHSSAENMVVAVGGPGSISAEYETPVVGYEVMEERTRFTIFKVWVGSKNAENGWFVFRRYTDFLRLSRKLKESFPGIRLSLPPKKWFGDNFDPCFLEDRLLGLQAFVTNITNHPEISRQDCVREFFCIGGNSESQDSIAESHALCQSLSYKVRTLKKKLREKDNEIVKLRSEVTLMRSQQQSLVKGLKLECSVTALTQNSGAHVVQMSSSSCCDESKFNGALNVHNFNVTLLQMMERSSSKDSNVHQTTSTPTKLNIPEIACDALALEEQNMIVDECSSSDNCVSRVSNKNSHDKNTNLHRAIRNGLDSPTSSDSGYREELTSRVHDLDPNESSTANDS